MPDSSSRTASPDFSDIDKFMQDRQGSSAEPASDVDSFMQEREKAAAATPSRNEQADADQPPTAPAPTMSKAEAGKTLEEATALSSPLGDHSVRNPQLGKLDLGPTPASPRSTAEGLVSEQEEQHGGAKLRVTPQDKVELQGRTANLSTPGVPETDVHTVAPLENPALTDDELTGSIRNFNPQNQESVERFSRASEVYPVEQTPGIGTTLEGAGAIQSGVQDYVQALSHPELFSSEEKAAEQRALGAAEVVGGAGEIISPLLAATPAAPVSNAIGIGTGLVASEAAGRTTKALGGSEQSQELARQIGWFLPSTLGAVSGIRGEVGETPAGGKAAVVSGLGDRVAGGVAEGPEGGVTVAGKVGSKKFSKTFGGGNGTQKLEAPTIEGQAPAGETLPVPINQPPVQTAAQAEAASQLGDAIQTAQKAAAADRAVGAVTGTGTATVPEPQAPPQEPPAPPLTDELLAGISQQIQEVPPEQRPQAVTELHDRLATALQQQGKVVLGGQLHVIDSDKKASTVAQKLINDEMKRVDKDNPEPESSTVAAPETKEATSAPASAEIEGAAPVRSDVDEFMGERQSLQQGHVSLKKGDEVAFTDNDGQEHTGTVKYAGNLAVRLVDKEGNKFEVAPSKVRGLAADQTEVTQTAAPAETPKELAVQSGAVKSPQGAGDKSTQPSETPAGAKQKTVYDNSGRPHTLGPGEYVQIDVATGRRQIFRENDSKTPKTDLTGQTWGWFDKNGKEIRRFTGHTMEELGKSMSDTKGLPKDAKLRQIDETPEFNAATIADNFDPHKDEIDWQAMTPEQQTELRDVLRKRGMQQFVVDSAKRYAESGSRDYALYGDEGGVGPETTTAALRNDRMALEPGKAVPKRLSDTSPAPSKGAAEPKYKHGSTQANIPKDSEAHSALESARQRISDSDLAGDGKDVGGNHVTVRYGLDGDIDKVRAYLEKQSPFEASLGKTESFPPSEHSDGAAVIKAPIESPELHRINGEIEKHGQFAPSSFPVYKPHATIAYVKAEKASRYTGMSVTHGKKFKVDHISITDREGNQHEVELKGATEPEKGKELAGQTPNREKFRIAYERHLGRAIDLAPQDYAYPKSSIPDVVKKMTDGLAKGSASKDSSAIRATLKELGIKNNYGAIKEYLNAEPTKKAEAAANPHPTSTAPAASPVSAPSTTAIVGQSSPEQYIWKKIQEKEIPVHTAFTGEGLASTLDLPLDKINFHAMEADDLIVKNGDGMWELSPRMTGESAKLAKQEKPQSVAPPEAAKQPEAPSIPAKGSTVWVDRNGESVEGTVVGTTKAGKVQVQLSSGGKVAVSPEKLEVESTPEAANEQPAKPTSEPAGRSDVPASGGQPLSHPESAGGSQLAEKQPQTGEVNGAAGNARTEPGRSSGEGGADLAPVGDRGTEPGPGEGVGNERIAEAQRERAKPERVAARNTDWFTFPEDFSVDAGNSTRLEWNINALKLVKKVEEGYKLTDEDRDALAHFVGWGALQHAFAPHDSPYSEQNKWYRAKGELDALLTPEEFARARNSTQNAHYTAPVVVGFMWDAAKRLGFKGGTVLEPSMGTGNFFGLMPKAIRNKVTAIGNELDDGTFKIAKLLYPSAQIYNLNYVDLLLPDNSVDLAIGNPPFGVEIYDPKYRWFKGKIHDYFFVKTLDKVRPGGMVMFITSTGTFDKRDSAVREALASKADLVSAFRMPSGTFDKNAGTAVTTDLILLRKRIDGEQPGGEAWLNTVAQEMPVEKEDRTMEGHINQYYVDHPENLLGTSILSKRMNVSYRVSLKPSEGKIEEKLKDALSRIPRNLFDKVQSNPAFGADTPVVFAKDNILEDQFTLDDKGNVMQRRNGRLVEPEVLKVGGKYSPDRIQRAKALVGLRDQTNELMFAMKTYPDDTEAVESIAKLQKDLKKTYDAYVKKHGLLHDKKARDVFEQDPHYPRLLALENYDRATKKGTPADIFTKRTIYPRQPLTAISSDPKEGLYQVLAERGKVDVDLMSRLSGRPADEITATLGKEGLIYKEPTSGEWQTKDKYLTGFVRDKLREAEKAVAQGMKEYQSNIEELKKVIPETIPINSGDPDKDIEVRLGATWIPTGAIEDFIRQGLNAGGYNLKVQYLEGNWKVDGVLRNALVTNSEFGNGEFPADTLLEMALNLKTPTAYDTIGSGESRQTVVNQERTIQAKQLQQRLAEKFSDWARTSQKWASKLEEGYNYLYNGLVLPEYDGSHLTFPGMNGTIQLQPHQKAAVWRLIQDGRGLLAHVVGAGKTFEMVASAMEMRRLGLAKKILIAVPNHLTEQWGKEFLHLYPGANVLVPTKKDFETTNRRRMMAKIATNDYDAVIIAHSQFNLMDISKERQQKTLSAQMEELEETIRAAQGASDGTQGSKRTVKQLEKAKDRLKARLDKLKDLKADRVINFDDTGIDTLMIDEAHEYKNLAFYTKMTRVAGLGQGDAKRAERLKMKTDYLLEKNNGRGVVFATGTPVQNTMAELNTMIKYVAPDVLQKYGIKFFDDWAANFGSVITAMELSADGRTYKARSKFARFTNVPELMNMFRSFADIKTAAELNLPVPKLEGGSYEFVEVPSNEVIEPIVDSLIQRAKAIRGEGGGKRPDPKEDNMLAVTMDGRKVATDARLMGSGFPDHPDSKINHAVREIFKEWRDGKKDRLTQLVFLDLYQLTEKEFKPELDLLAGGSVKGGNAARGKIVDRVVVNLYNDMRDKLVEMGVPKDEIAIIHEYQKEAQKQSLFDDMNTGKKRILMGSTQKMGAGMNVQRKLKVLHHIDLPWRPGDLEQRNGRIIRQGNTNKDVRVKFYATKKTFDAYMAQTLQGKAEFINQVMSGKYTGRSMTDAANDLVLSLEELKAIASGNPDVKRKMELEAEQAKLLSLKRSHESSLRDREWRANALHQRAASGRAHADMAEKWLKQYRDFTGVTEEAEKVLGEAEDKLDQVNERLKLEKEREDKDKDFIAKLEGMQKEQRDVVKKLREEVKPNFEMKILGETFTDAKIAREYLAKAALPPYNFEMTYNSLPVFVETSMQGKKAIEPTLAIKLPWDSQAVGAYGGQGTKDLSALMRKLQSGIRSAPAREVTTARIEADGAEHQARDLDAMEKKSFPEQQQLDKVQKELGEVNGRLGIGDIKKQASEEEVQADVDNTPDSVDEAPEDDDVAYSFGWDSVDNSPDEIAASYEPPDDVFPPVITLSQSARALVNRVVGRTWRGVNMTVKTSRNIATSLNGIAADKASAGVDTHDIRLLASMFERASSEGNTSGVVAISDESARPEEMFHSVQRHVGSGSIMDHLPTADVAALQEHPAWEPMQQYLEENGYKGQPNEILIAEAAAKIATMEPGPYLYGLQPEDAASWLYDYMAAIAKQHGVEVLPKFAEKIGTLAGEYTAEIINEVQNGETGQAATDTGIHGNGEANGQQPQQSVGGEGALAPNPNAPEGEESLFSTSGEPADRTARVEPTTVSMGAVPLPVDAIKGFWKADVAPALEKFGMGMAATTRLMVETVYPRIEESSLIGRKLGIGVKRDILDSFMKLKADRDKAMYMLSQFGEKIKDFFDRIPEQRRIEFLDRYKTGQKQVTPELDELASFYRAMDDAMYQQVQNYRPSLNQLENHFRLFWDKLPMAVDEDGKLVDRGDKQKGVNKFFSKRPFEGTKGMLKKHSLATASEGLARGGKLVSTNPQTLFELGQMDSMKFVTAHKFWDAMGEIGHRVFVKNGQKIPAGFERLDDRIAQVYYRAQVLKEDLSEAESLEDVKTRSAALKAGEWYVEENSHRLLKNFLSRDLIREHAAGRGLLWMKNMGTAIELGMSPFHAVFETIEAMGSQFGLGMVKMWNQGLRQGDLGAFLSGISDIATSPVAPVTSAVKGGNLISFARDKARQGDMAGAAGAGDVENLPKPNYSPVMKAFKNKLELRDATKAAKFLKQHPDADQLLDDLFAGGGQLDMSRDYEVNTLKTIREQWTAGNPIGAFIRVFPAIGSHIMAPLFKTYIPRLKVGFWMSQYSQMLEENHAGLASGKVTRAELARKAWFSVENRFGEMNFDNLFWNRTFKTSLQLMFRSVTWKGGNVGLFAGGSMRQARDVFEWLNLVDSHVADDGKPEGEEPNDEKPFGEKAIPHLDADFAWILGTVAITAILGTMLSYWFTHRPTWELANEDSDGSTWDFVKRLYTETVHPRSGSYDFRGKPMRYSLPTYWKDFEHGTTSPRNYVLGSLSSTIGRTIDTLENRDFGGNYVYNPNETTSKKAIQIGEYVMPSPFSFSNYQKMKDQGDSEAAIGSLFGFTRAPRDLDLSSAEQRMLDLKNASRTPFTPEQIQDFKEKRDRITSGLGTAREQREAIKSLSTPYVVKLFKSLPYEQAIDVYDNYASSEEQIILKPYLNRKRANLLKRDPARVQTAEGEE